MALMMVFMYVAPADQAAGDAAMTTILGSDQSGTFTEPYSPDGTGSPTVYGASNQFEPAQWVAVESTWVQGSPITYAPAVWDDNKFTIYDDPNGPPSGDWAPTQAEWMATKNLTYVDPGGD